MKSVISVLGVLFLSASASGAVFDPGHVFWDLTAEQDTYVVGATIPSQASLGNDTDFTVQSVDLDPTTGSATTVENWTDPNTGQTMPGKAILLRRDSGHTGNGSEAYLLLNGGGDGYDRADPMVTGRIKVSCDIMIDSSTVIDPELAGWKAEGYVHATGWSTVMGQTLKNSVGFQTKDEEIVDYDPVGLYIKPYTWANYPMEPLVGDFYGYVHHVEMILDLDAQTVQQWADGRTNGAYALPTSTTGGEWEIYNHYRFQLPQAAAAGSDYTQFVWDNIKVEVVEAPVGLPGDFDGDDDVDGADFLLWQRDNGVGTLSDWQTHFGEPFPPATVAVPEPATLSLLAVLGLMGVGLIRRQA